mmetsp:Transcript_46146/g.118907  ORF Transcript_46146/g.118907 Transcript_46146/m.118907 type:complete len:80 (-) Transcript_46146:303-542(-)
MAVLLAGLVHVFAHLLSLPRTQPTSLRLSVFVCADWLYQSSLLVCTRLSLACMLFCVTSVSCLNGPFRPWAVKIQVSTV